MKGEKYAGKKFCLNWVLNSQPHGHKSDKLTTEPPRLEVKFEHLSCHLQELSNLSSGKGLTLYQTTNC